MQTKPRHRLAVDAELTLGGQLTLAGNPAHYLTHVVRLGVGDVVSLFNRTDGEWSARITDIGKRDVTLQVEESLRPPAIATGLTVCFAPIKGGRLETIIEKATELGASVLQPVITQRTIVDKVNLERAESIAREAAEQCERVDWPEIREPVKLAALLGNWPQDLPLIYGDESGESASITQLLADGKALKLAADGNPSTHRGEVRRGAAAASSVQDNIPTEQVTPPPQPSPYGGGRQWAILVGPEGGFTPEEFQALTRVKSAIGVGLGPRILRADTAVITLCALTLAAWGDWDARPRFTQRD